ncbi:Uncharacterised protein [Mycobacterium tuberculosis]|uniref:Uncharacterized protein n=1 Tax=Mycobacterium tuberculosis TaxID=1773 RepID=A0A916LG54_MYCTX|nr:Uncharacterised protein [Mycobacterium tuberculosis]
MQRKTGQFPAVGQRNGRSQRRIAGDCVHRMYRAGQRQVGQIYCVGWSFFDQVEHQRRGTQLQIGRRLGKVGVADDDVQPAVPVGVGVRFVAGVDDAALERCFQPYLDLDVVRTLG